MVDIIHRVGIKAPASKVFAALATVDGLAGWWTHDTSGTSAPGGRIVFRFRDEAGGDIGGFHMQVTELLPDRRVRWQVLDGPADWIGSEIEFQLSTQDRFTIVLFGHRGWREASESMAHCSTKWASFLLSLRDLVETGKGRPAPHDLKIGDWH